MDELEKLYEKEFESSKIEILENLEYLEKNALTFEQLSRMNQAKRILYKANKMEKEVDKVFVNTIKRTKRFNK